MTGNNVTDTRISHESSPQQDILLTAQEVLRDEAAGILDLEQSLGDSFTRAVEILLESKGMLIVTGLGKSGVVARKVAGTLTSTGTPATFVHPVEGMHGDLGIVTQRDNMLAFSNSGNTDEVIRFVQGFKRLGGMVVAVTRDADSKLSQVSEILLQLPHVGEAGPLGLAPTTSTTMMMALGDALAMSLLKQRGFTEDNYAHFHPEGTLGKRLLLSAGDLMFAGDHLPCMSESSFMRDVVLEMTSKGLGQTVLINEAGQFAGVLTDGDLRRLIGKAQDVMNLTAKDALALSRRTDLPKGPFTVAPEEPAVRCRRIMTDNKVTSLVVLDIDRKPVGLVRLQEITAAGL